MAVNVNFAVFLCNAVFSARGHTRSLLYLDQNLPLEKLTMWILHIVEPDDPPSTGYTGHLRCRLARREQGLGIVFVGRLEDGVDWRQLDVRDVRHWMSGVGLKMVTLSYLQPLASFCSDDDDCYCLMPLSYVIIPLEPSCYFMFRRLYPSTILHSAHITYKSVLIWIRQTPGYFFFFAICSKIMLY